MIHIFIVNPYAGNGGNARRLREQLNEIDNLKYYIFHTKKSQKADALIREILPLFDTDEKIRFYACGGQGTITSVVNGFDNLDNVEIAFYPQGLTNDILKMFDGDMSQFSQIKNLVEGDVVKIDYIQTNHGRALNTMTVGLDAVVVKKILDYESLNILGAIVPYSLGLFYGIFVQKLLEYEFSIDGKAYSEVAMELYFGNGGIFGGNLRFDLNASVQDGVGSFIFIPKKKYMDLFKTLGAIVSKKNDNKDKYFKVEKVKKFCVRRKDGKNISMNIDGDINEQFDYWEGEIVEKGISLVVPKGVTVR